MRYGASRRLFGAPFCSPWSSRVRAVVAHDDDALPVTAGGQNGHVGNKHFIDQAERYATGNLRPVYFYRNQLQGHIEREYRPGSSFLTVAGSHGPVLPAPRGDTSGNRAPTRVSAATGRAPCAPGCRAPHRAPPRSSRGSHSRRAGRRGRVGRWRAPMARCGTSCTRSSSACTGSASRSPPGSSSSPRDSAPLRRTPDALSQPRHTSPVARRPGSQGDDIRYRRLPHGRIEESTERDAKGGDASAHARVAVRINDGHGNLRREQGAERDRLAGNPQRIRRSAEGDR